MIPSTELIMSEFDVSRETADSLTLYCELLLKWTDKINLISKRSKEELWTRHIVDSVQVFKSLNCSGPCLWADFGSGGGLPGVIVAILGREVNPELSVTCVESDQRKAVFLRSVSRETKCNISVVGERIEKLTPLNADVISARALAPLSNLLEFTDRHLKSGGQAIFPKGVSYQEEISNARKLWNFKCEAIPSITSNDSVLLKIRELNRV